MAITYYHHRGRRTVSERIRGHQVTFMIAVAAGILLGLFYRFYVLIPGTLALMLICLITALSRGDRMANILVAVLLPPVCLQAGYVLGLCLRDLIGTTRHTGPGDAAEADGARHPRRSGRQPAVALVQAKSTLWHR
jgi:hypothetical protein